MTHTPGPWVWRWKSGSLHQVGTDKPYGATVLAPTYSHDEGLGIEVSDADDRLIAAAPDLLAALKKIALRGGGLSSDPLVYCSETIDSMEALARAAIARAAIARAEGATP